MKNVLYTDNELGYKEEIANSVAKEMKMWSSQL